uniref:Uncharacterized protein n=1 Tax=Panthera tigris altaica TaxID=74533 RepID=A0A8C9J7B1_PANTA
MSILPRVISIAKAPGAVGPYSQALLVNSTIYISGQLVLGGMAEETKQALVNMGEILKATTVLWADINGFKTVNETHKQHFKSSFPARATYRVAVLPKEAVWRLKPVAVQGPLTTASL